MVANSINLSEIKVVIVSHHLGGEDFIIWTPNSNGKFSINSVWEEVKQRRERVSWYGLIWFKKHFPRHSLIAWLGIKGKLMTKDKLVRIGPISQNSYNLCNMALKSMNRLFFQFKFNSQICLHVHTPQS